MRQLVQLQNDAKKLAAAKVRVIAISYDAQADLAKFAKKRGITFSLLSDPKSEAIDAFGVRNTRVRKGSNKDGIPQPGTFVLTKDGVIGAKLTGSVMFRHSASQLIEAATKARARAAKPKAEEKGEPQAY